MNELKHLLKKLGIDQIHIDVCKAPLQNEATVLVNSEPDFLGRSQQMTPSTLHCWQRMADDAKSNSINLQLVSAYRSIEYQCDLIQGKIESGRDINEILKVNAIPGYSEHHTGCALDLTTPGFLALDESFDRSDAFSWLVENASRFDFTMTYPKDNNLGINYEPWHWCCNHR